MCPAGNLKRLFVHWSLDFQMWIIFLPSTNDYVHYICRFVWLSSQLSCFQQNVNIGDYSPSPDFLVISRIVFSHQVVTLFATCKTTTVNDFVFFFDSVGTFSEPISKHDPFHETAHPLDYRLVTISFFFWTEKVDIILFTAVCCLITHILTIKNKRAKKHPEMAQRIELGSTKSAAKSSVPSLLSRVGPPRPPPCCWLVQIQPNRRRVGGNCLGGGWAGTWNGRSNLLFFSRCFFFISLHSSETSEAAKHRPKSHPIVRQICVNENLGQLLPSTNCWSRGSDLRRAKPAVLPWLPNDSVYSAPFLEVGSGWGARCYLFCIRFCSAVFAPIRGLVWVIIVRDVIGKPVGVVTPNWGVEEV